MTEAGAPGPQEPKRQAALLEGRSLTKTYGQTKALRGVDFHLGRGEILAIFGENGAGKSTLLRIISGATSPDAGALTFAGVAQSLDSPRDALKQGVVLVPQELAACDGLSVAENILIGHLPGRRGSTSRRRILREAEELTARYGIELPLRPLLAELPLAERQLVEVMKGLSRDAKVLLLDEPTAALNSSEAADLLRRIRGLVARGVSAILITHRIEEALEFADRVLVLRNGEVVYDAAAAETTKEVVVESMLGEEAGAVTDAARPLPTGRVRVHVKEWSVPGRSPLNNFSMHIRQDEIVAVYGQRGSGIEAVAAAFAGNMPRMHGKLIIDGQEMRVPHSPRERARQGIAFVTNDRRGNGLALDLSITQNVLYPTNPATTRRGFLRKPAHERRLAEAIAAKFRVRHSGLKTPVRHLSGGNQQKVLLAANTLGERRLVVLHEPTRGVDIGSRAEIHRFVRSFPDAGVPVLLVSSDVDEIVAVADRVVVLRHGAILRELSGKQVSIDEVLLAANGDGDE